LTLKNWSAFRFSRRIDVVDRFKITSKKYDGSLREAYDAFLVEETTESLLLYTPPGTLGYDHRKRSWYEAPDGLLEIYFKTRWYTVWHICEQNSNLNKMYIHISMPAAITPAGIEWVDLDLDYRVHLDGRLERLDEAEYAANRIRMAYPQDVLEQVQGACSEVEAGANRVRFLSITRIRSRPTKVFETGDRKTNKLCMGTLRGIPAFPLLQSPMKTVLL